ncbi:MAG TPA: MetQ/NlpA family ABC transporter substrate-binding protein [Bradyrhizobium sp.]|nr:MetQ/NlpA family ABC transporter substrate-binding protein [Bradyrhizobium sp.]
MSKKEVLKAEIIEFSDWNQPNATLQSGDIDINIAARKGFGFRHERVGGELHRLDQGR